MKHTSKLLAALSLVCGSAVAGPSSNVAWDGATRTLIAGGDAGRGQQLAAQCASCHGADGMSPTAVFPHVAGQLPGYTFKQLRDYKDGTRADNPIMRGLTAPLTDQAMADLAAFYASKPLPAGASGDAPTLVTRGDGKRLIPACATCHGRAGAGKDVNAAALAGQSKGYLAATLRNYASGVRGNDVYGVMRSIAKAMTPQEIEAVSNYYAQ
ncbi:MAG: cytochrome c4 [Chromatiales bacterium]|nr:cytochrome c4 [Chromatiales bacterium]